MRISSVRTVKFGSFSNDDGKEETNVEKTIVVISKTTRARAAHLLVDCLPSLLDHHVKFPYVTFFGARKHCVEFFCHFLTFRAVPKNSTAREIHLSLTFKATKLEKNVDLFQK